MKLLHIADLHIGKHVNGFNMIEDQKYILEQILKMVETEKPDWSQWGQTYTIDKMCRTYNRFTLDVFPAVSQLLPVAAFSRSIGARPTQLT